MIRVTVRAARGQGLTTDADHTQRTGKQQRRERAHARGRDRWRGIVRHLEVPRDDAFADTHVMVEGSNRVVTREVTTCACGIN